VQQYVATVFRSNPLNVSFRRHLCDHLDSFPKVLTLGHPQRHRDIGKFLPFVCPTHGALAASTVTPISSESVPSLASVFLTIGEESIDLSVSIS
jgi:hypothetical protein